MNQVVRRFARDPFRSGVIVAVLAVSMGLTAAIFSMVNAVLYSSPPGIHDPEQLVVLSHRPADPSGDEESELSYEAFRFYADNAKETGLFDSVTAAFEFAGSLGQKNSTIEARVALVASNYFTTYGVSPAAGRFFSSEEEAQGSAPVCVLALRTVELLGESAESILGERVQVNGVYATVIGVAAERFRGPHIGSDIDVWLTVSVFEQVALHINPERRRLFWVGHELPVLEVVARAKAGRDIDSLQPTAAFQHSEGSGGRRYLALAKLTALPQEEREEVGRLALALISLVLASLLIAVINAASILVAHHASMQRTFATMAALGATSQRIVWRMFVDCMALSVISAVVAMVLSPAILHGFGVLVDDRSFDYVMQLTSPIHWRVLMLLCLITVGVALSCTLLSRGRSSVVLMANGNLHGSMTTAPLTRLKSVLLSGQFLVLFFLTSVYAILSIGLADLYGRVDNLPSQGYLLGSVPLDHLGYDTREASRLASNLLQRLNSNVGIAEATLSMTSPYARGGAGLLMRAGGSDESRRVRLNLVAPGFFGSVGPPLVRGRPFGDSDSEVSERVAIVNEAFVEEVLDGGLAIGREVVVDEAEEPTIIVGVASNVQSLRLLGAEPPLIYFPLSQPPRRVPLTGIGLTFYVAPAVSGVARVTQEVLHGLEPAAAVADVRSFEQEVDRQFARQRQLTRLIGAVTVFGLILGVGGLYGMMSYLASLRRKDMAVRMALGGRPLSVARWLCFEMATPLGVAVALGSVLGLSLLPPLSTFLYGARIEAGRVVLQPLLLLLAVCIFAIVTQTVATSRVPVAATLRQEQ